MYQRGRSSSGRASGSQSESGEFESRRLHLRIRMLFCRLTTLLVNLQLFPLFSRVQETRRVLFCPWNRQLSRYHSRYIQLSCYHFLFPVHVLRIAKTTFSLSFVWYTTSSLSFRVLHVKMLVMVTLLPEEKQGIFHARRPIEEPIGLCRNLLNGLR